MLPEVHANPDELSSIGGQREPPRGRLAASIQEMSPGRRWALGLGLAFLSSFAIVLADAITAITVSSTTTSAVISAVIGTVNAISFVVAFVLALAAGFVLSRWRTVVALAVATAAGGLVGGWVLVLVSPATYVEGLTGMTAVWIVFTSFVVFELGPIILFLLAGIGIGQLEGITLGQPYALSARQASVSRWIAALSPVIGAGFLARIVPGMLSTQATQGDVSVVLFGIPYAVLLAATCLLAGWLLRSWVGFVAAPLVYVGIAILPYQQLFGSGSGWTGEFALYIVLPAVVMSAIGTAIGMYTAGHRGQHPHYGELAT